MPWLKLFPLLLTLLSFLQPLAANASTLLLPLAAVESAAHRDTVSFCRSTAKDSSAHRDALGASLVAVIDGTAVAADYENIGGGIADFGMVAVIGGVKGAGETGAKGGAGEVAPQVTNAANHIFGQKSLAKHNLGGVLNAFEGDSVAAFNALEGATQQLANQGAIKGVFQTTVEVAGQTVTVRGAVVEGTVKVGTAFISRGRP